MGEFGGEAVIVPVALGGGTKAAWLARRSLSPKRSDMAGRSQGCGWSGRDNTKNEEWLTVRYSVEQCLCDIDVENRGYDEAGTSSLGTTATGEGMGRGGKGGDAPWGAFTRDLDRGDSSRVWGGS